MSEQIICPACAGKIEIGYTQPRPGEPLEPRLCPFCDKGVVDGPYGRLLEAVLMPMGELQTVKGTLEWLDGRILGKRGANYLWTVSYLKRIAQALEDIEGRL